MGSNEEYLKNLLEAQELPKDLIEGLRDVRNSLLGIFRQEVTDEDVRYFYAGSYRKGTMILESHDLDLVIYYPCDSNKNLYEIFTEVKAILQRNGYSPREKNVALRCIRKWTSMNYPNFHIDVVPAKARDDDYDYASLYKSQDDTWLQTNIFIHEEAVKETRRRNLIKLLKLWKARNGIDCTTFILELVFIRYLDTLESVSSNIETLLSGILCYIRDTIETIKLVDPANTNNIVSNDLSDSQRYQLHRHAKNACDAQYWSQVFKED